MRHSMRMVFLPLALLALTAPGCSLLDSNDDGNVRVVLSASGGTSLSPALSDDDDRPGENFFSRLESANVTFASILARNLDGQLIDLNVSLPSTIDLVGLANGNQVTFPAGTLPPGDYDQLVVVLTEVEAVFKDGGSVAITPPGGGWTSIVRVAPFTVVEGQTVTIDLNLRLGKAFRRLGDEFRFFPEFEGHSHEED
jgi:hypothetical protein